MRYAPHSRALSIIALGILASCTSYIPPRQHEIDTTGVVARPQAEIWETLETFFAEAGIPVAEMNSETGVFRVVGAPSPGRAYGDCGAEKVSSLGSARSTPIMPETIDVDVRVRPKGPNSTEVAIDAALHADARAIYCASTEKFERKLYARLQGSGSGFWDVSPEGTPPSTGAVRRSTPPVDSQIRGRCASEWPGDYVMQRYCVRRQSEARGDVGKWLVDTGLADIGLDDYERALDAERPDAVIYFHCSQQWEEDFVMIAYCIDRQEEALWELRGF